VSSTEDAAKGLSDSFRKFKHHWTPNSRMNVVYEHLSQSIIPDIQRETWKKVVGQDVDAPGQQKEPQVQLSKICRRCSYQNSRDSAYCNRCGFTLDENELSNASIARAKVDQFIDRLSQDPRKLEKFLSMIP
jgi:ribosomal protein L37E